MKPIRLLIILSILPLLLHSQAPTTTVGDKPKTTTSTTPKVPSTHALVTIRSSDVGYLYVDGVKQDGHVSIGSNYIELKLTSGTYTLKVIPTVGIKYPPDIGVEKTITVVNGRSYEYTLDLKKQLDDCCGLVRIGTNFACAYHIDGVFKKSTKYGYDEYLTKGKHTIVGKYYYDTLKVVRKVIVVPHPDFIELELDTNSSK